MLLICADYDGLVYPMTAWEMLMLWRAIAYMPLGCSGLQRLACEAAVRILLDYGGGVGASLFRYDCICLGLPPSVAVVLLETYPPSMIVEEDD